jgi:putative transposase
MITGSGRSARLRIPLFGNVKINLYRPLKGTPKQVTIHRESTGRWWACIMCDLGEAPAKLDPATIREDRKVGIDLGLTNVIATSDGEVVANPRHFQKEQDRLAERQRRVAKQTQKGSNGHKKAKRLVAKSHKRIANQRRDFFWKLAKALVLANDLIAIEKLNIAGLAQSGLGKHVNYVAWRILVHAIMCKAEEAGAWVIEVDPRYTSQECSGCGHVVPKDLSVRVHHCSFCGLTLDRDVNAARVILMRAVAAPGMGVEQAADARRSVKARRSKRNRGAQTSATQL